MTVASDRAPARQLGQPWRFLTRHRRSFTLAIRVAGLVYLALLSPVILAIWLVSVIGRVLATVTDAMGWPMDRLKVLLDWSTLGEDDPWIRRYYYGEDVDPRRESPLGSRANARRLAEAIERSVAADADRS